MQGVPGGGPAQPPGGRLLLRVPVLGPDEQPGGGPACPRPGCVTAASPPSAHSPAPDGVAAAVWAVCVGGGGRRYPPHTAARCAGALHTLDAFARHVAAPLPAVVSDVAGQLLRQAPGGIRCVPDQTACVPGERTFRFLHKTISTARATHMYASGPGTGAGRCGRRTSAECCGCTSRGQPDRWRRCSAWWTPCCPSWRRARGRQTTVCSATPVYATPHVLNPSLMCDLVAAAHSLRGVARQC